MIAVARTAAGLTGQSGSSSLHPSDKVDGGTRQPTNGPFLKREARVCSGTASGQKNKQRRKREEVSLYSLLFFFFFFSCMCLCGSHTLQRLGDPVRKQPKENCFVLVQGSLNRLIIPHPPPSSYYCHHICTTLSPLLEEGRQNRRGLVGGEGEGKGVLASF
jgi:hypothetical protein